MATIGRRLLHLRTVYLIANAQKYSIGTPTSCFIQSLVNGQAVGGSPLRLCARNFSDKTKSGETVDTFRDREELKEQLFEESTRVDEETKQSKERDDREQRADELRTQIWAASLQFVSDFGWTRKSLIKGAESLGLPGVTHGMFPDGGIELVQYFYTTCNANLAQHLEKKAAEPGIDSKLFLSNAIRMRLQMVEPYLSTWPQAIAMMALPQNAPKSIANVLTLVDDICYYAGNRSVDTTWYTERIALAGVYKTTEIFMLQDGSPNHEATWTFLDRRMDDLVLLKSVLAQSEEAGQLIHRTVASAFDTARNILGMNLNRR